jgi:hypothetical protein
VSRKLSGDIGLKFSVCKNAVEFEGQQFAKLDWREVNFRKLPSDFTNPTQRILNGRREVKNCRSRIFIYSLNFEVGLDFKKLNIIGSYAPCFDPYLTALAEAVGPFN